MRRLILVLLVAVFALVWVAGCSSETKVQTHDQQTIKSEPKEIP